MVVEQVGILARDGRKDGCGAGWNSSLWMEGWLCSKWEFWPVDGMMIVEQVEILAGGWKDFCGAGGNIGWVDGRMAVEKVRG